MANKIKVIGVGPGSAEYITPAALKLIQEADILVGGDRLLKLFAGSGKTVFAVKNNLPEMIEFINTNRSEKSIAVLASGDPSFYGILAYLKKHYALTDLIVEPGISSIQLACARLCISWEDAVFFSAHGRDIQGLESLIRNHSKVVVLTDRVNTPEFIARYLLRKGITQKSIYVCENLSYDDELIYKFEINKAPAEVGKSGCVVVITDE